MFGLIVNPVSGGQKCTTWTEQIRAVLTARGEESRVYETACEGDGTRQTKRALEDGCREIVCMGGDGTLSEMADALIGTDARLYLVPVGTGNDFARSMGLPHDPLKAFCAQLDGEEARIDCGTINGHAFVNISGSGFDVDVLRKTEELKAVYPGDQAYRKAVLAVISQYKPFCAEMSMDGGAFVPCACTIAEIANGQYFGGGMCVAPSANLQDGWFDVVTVRRVPGFAIPFLLPLFIGGWHVHLPIAKVVRAKEVILRSAGMVVNIDGRLMACDEAHYRMVPGALRMKLPIAKS